MSENRMKILQMLATGQITAEEAERLIAALQTEPTASAANGGVNPKPKYLRVVVSDQNSQGDPVKVNVRVPMQLLRYGVKLASLIPPEARDRVNSAMRKEGVAFDLGQVKPENVEEMVAHLDDLTVDIDDKKKTTVRIFCE
jgi:hypothetical protein